MRERNCTQESCYVHQSGSSPIPSPNTTSIEYGNSSKTRTLYSQTVGIGHVPVVNISCIRTNIRHVPDSKQFLTKELTKQIGSF